MGRAIAQIIQYAQKKKPDTKPAWLTVNNNWSVGEIYAKDKPDIIGFNLYPGVEYSSSGGARKTLWLPIDDRPYFVGREWDTKNRSSRKNITTSYMDENYNITAFNSTNEYWDAFSDRYASLESDRQLDWAKPYAGKIVLFDLDGTIIKTDNAVFETALTHALEHMAGKLSGNNISVSVSDLRQKYEEIRGTAKENLYGFGRYRDMELRLYNTLLAFGHLISN
ncbi:Uncharacterised protein [uncultured archaeon]|nr:Uncharacterised protein [uncultured archaeon]